MDRKKRKMKKALKPYKPSKSNPPFPRAVGQAVSASSQPSQGTRENMRKVVESKKYGGSVRGLSGGPNHR